MTIAFIKTNPRSIDNIWNSKAQTIILNVNAEGKMAGIAKGLMNYDLEAASEYMRLCAREEVCVGVPVLIRSRKHQGQQYILCPIKARSGDAPKERALDACLRTINRNGGIWGVTSIATHPMGCGSSDIYLLWEQVVYPLMHKWLSAVPVPVKIYGASAPVVVQPTPEPEVMTVVTPLDPTLPTLNLDEKVLEKIGLLPF